MWRRIPEFQRLMDSAPHLRNSNTKQPMRKPGERDSGVRGRNMCIRHARARDHVAITQTVIRCSLFSDAVPVGEGPFALELLQPQHLHTTLCQKTEEKVGTFVTRQCPPPIPIASTVHAVCPF